MSIDEHLQLIKRGTAEIVPEEALREKLAKSRRDGRPLRIKLGLDPTAPDIHLGNAVVLRKMRQFQNLGHEVYIIIGDFTASIGDPSGRSATRPQLADDEIRENAKTYYDQYCRILDPDRTKVVFNSEWLGKLSFADVIKIAAKVTVARILERDDFATRLQEGRPISLHELLYPVCQAYDSVELRSDVEVGATEQKFNIMMGRDLQGQYGQDEQVGLFMPILPGLDGVQKMSKSLGNYVGITESPRDMFGKIMSLADDLMRVYYELCTDVPMDEVQQITQGVASGEVHPMEAKKRLAREIVAIYHSPQAATEAQSEFERVFSNREMPQDIPEVVLTPDDMPGGQIGIVKLLVKCKFVKSSGEGRRLADQGGAVIVLPDGRKWPEYLTMHSLITPQDGMIVRAGKLRYARLKLGG